jgi:hypothetical protein
MKTHCISFTRNNRCLFFRDMLCVRSEKSANNINVFYIQVSNFLNCETYSLSS